MKVVHITTVHYAFDTRIFQRECQTLSEAGYDVILIAPHETDDVVSGVQIRTLQKPRSRLQRVTKTLIQAAKKAFAERASVYHFHDPELIPLGLTLRIAGRKVIYDVHEDYPRDILSKYYLPRILRRPIANLASIVEGLAGNACTAVLAATPAIANRFPNCKTVLVRNFPLPSELTSQVVTAYRSRPHDVAYVGDITRVRGIKEMIVAVNAIPRRLGVRLILAGRFNPAGLWKELQEEMNCDKVEFLGWQTRPEVASMLGQVRVGLVTLHPTQSFQDSQPLKLFEYMSAGIPVVASDFPLWREVIESAACGIVVDPKDPTEIAAAIKWMISNGEEAERMGINGRKAVLEQYNWGTEAKKLLDVYSALAG